MSDTVDNNTQKVNTTGMLTEISMMMREYSDIKTKEEERAEVMYALLEDMVYSLGEIANITQDKIDVDFLLMIVASYIVGKKSGNLDDDVKTPIELFKERIIPLIDDSDVSIEPIVDEIDTKEEDE